MLFVGGLVPAVPGFALTAVSFSALNQFGVRSTLQPQCADVDRVVAKLFQEIDRASESVAARAFSDSL